MDPADGGRSDVLTAHLEGAVKPADFFEAFCRAVLIERDCRFALKPQHSAVVTLFLDWLGHHMRERSWHEALAAGGNTTGEIPCPWNDFGAALDSLRGVADRYSAAYYVALGVCRFFERGLGEGVHKLKGALGLGERLVEFNCLLKQLYDVVDHLATESAASATLTPEQAQGRYQQLMNCIGSLVDFEDDERVRDWLFVATGSVLEIDAVRTMCSSLKAGEADFDFVKQLSLEHLGVWFVD